MISSFGQRFGAHLMLAVVALVLILIGRVSLTEEAAAVDIGVGGETAVSPILSPATTLPPPVVSGSAAQPQPISALPVVSDNSLSPLPNPHTFQAQPPSHQFETYIVERGDTPNKIADQFGISAATLLGGNPWMSQESNQLQSGTEITILPSDGALHTVKPGETVESIAADYEVPAEAIIAFASNNLEFPYRLQPDTQLMVPGAEIGLFYWTAPKTVAGSGSNGGGSGPSTFTVQGTGSFIWPMTSRCITQYAWYGHPALDMAVPEGTPVVAADRGTVTYASWAAGTYFDYGYLVVVNHGNGFETLYAHLGRIDVFPGQVVEKGAVIAASGNSGRSSGPHLHLEVRLNDIRYDPLLYLSGPTQDCTYTAN